MRFGPTSDTENTKYYINEKEITKTSQEKDLGVIIEDNLKFSAHISNKINKANQIMGLIRRSFTYLDQTILRPVAFTPWPVLFLPGDESLPPSLPLVLPLSLSTTSKSVSIQ